MLPNHCGNLHVPLKLHSGTKALVAQSRFIQGDAAPRALVVGKAYKLEAWHLTNQEKDTGGVVLWSGVSRLARSRFSCSALAKYWSSLLATMASLSLASCGIAPFVSAGISVTSLTAALWTASLGSLPHCITGGRAERVAA